ncbi:hypothetical protein CHH28_19035 [Bacterioplanes sanyensis]|uniref:Lacal_2735 family protein n=1 Tax=Bacterioplanes sanyensis TaxID=1249553 RepID=A0A222FPB3_9GAMM|nr:DUF6435 family protein [Bacterioplanes sanyensis]ASP40630.1 hypothetical protein CHH28_19035 [Bacterioplanes sanyensis]
MFSFFKTDPTKKLRQQYQRKLEQAMQAQRNGDMRSYAQLSSEADSLYRDIQQHEQSDNK